MGREKERKIEGSFGTNRETGTERRKGWRARARRMRRCTRWRSGERVANSTRTERARAGGWLCTAAEREASKEEQRRERGAEDAPIRTGMETRGGTSARGDREGTRHRADADERARRNGGGGVEKERRYARKERRNDIEREREREAARVKTGGRARRRASACPAEGARRPHMCSETNVRSECRLLPIIRCRGVPLCARG